jgi:hypothetical protein
VALSDALFILIGGDPLTQVVEGWLRRDERGYLMTGADLLAGTDRRRWWPLERDPMPLESRRATAYLHARPVLLEPIDEIP